MPHRDAVIHADCVEEKRHASRCPDALLHVVAHGLEMDVTRNDVDVAVANRDERLVPVAFADPRGPKEATMGCAGIASFDRVGTHWRGSRSGLAATIRRS